MKTKRIQGFIRILCKKKASVPETYLLIQNHWREPPFLPVGVSVTAMLPPVIWTALDVPARTTQRR